MRQVYSKWLCLLFTKISLKEKDFNSLAKNHEMLLFEPKTLLNKMNLIAANIENRIMHFNKFSYNKKVWQGIHTAFKAYMDFICSIIEDRDIWSFMYLME